MNVTTVVKNKPWYRSRILWIGAIALVLDILALPEFIALVPLAAVPYINLVAVILVMVRRSWGTDTNLTK